MFGVLLEAGIACLYSSPGFGCGPCYSFILGFCVCCPVLSVSLCCPFLTAPSVFSDVYLHGNNTDASHLTDTLLH